MAGETDKKPAAEGGEAGLDGGSYEVIRARLVAQAKELADRTHALNARRQQTFGGTELAVVANERVRTENNCVPADILQVGGHLLLGYNVFFGLKKEVVLDDVFSLQSFDAGAPEGQAINPVPAATLPAALPGKLKTLDVTRTLVENIDAVAALPQLTTIKAPGPSPP